MKRMKTFGTFSAASASEYKEKAAFIAAVLTLVISWMETPNEKKEEKNVKKSDDDELFDPTDCGSHQADMILGILVKEYSRV